MTDTAVPSRQSAVSRPVSEALLNEKVPMTSTLPPRATHACLKR